MSKPKFYLTTPIYYVNARPHIGHAYTTIAADVIARRHRLLGDDTFFLTGTDEHGQKVERSAAAAGVSPQEFSDKVSASFKALWDRMGITYDDYIRTTEPRHTGAVQKLFQLLCDKDAIYLSTYTGQYSVGEEMFIDGPPGTIGPDGKPTETVTEENYFFRLSRYQLELIDLIESDTLLIQPESRKNEVLSFLCGDFNEFLKIETAEYDRSLFEQKPDGVVAVALPPGDVLDLAERNGRIKRSARNRRYIPGYLRDLSVSRSSFTWGIPVPEPAASETKQKHVIYVWLDALANYMTAVGYGSDDPTKQEQFKRYWPADLHIMAKEITRQHCIYWPAFLLAAGLPLPKAVTAHGWLLFDDSKMSKSKGNIVRTETILDAFCTLKPKPTDGPGAVLSDEYWKHEQDLFASDVLRYFLLREIPFGQDGSFSFDALITRYNADLANGYGNLVSRTLTMIQKYFDGYIPFGKMAERVGLAIDIDVAAITNNYIESDFSSLLHNIMNIVRAADSHITSTAPWKIAADPARTEELKDVLYTAVESIRIVNTLIEPILPYTSGQVFAQLGIPTRREPGSEPNWAAERLGELAPIFPRAPKELIQLMTDMENNTNTTPKPEPSKLMDEKSASAAPVPADPTHPGAPPRTSALPIANPGATVGGSHATTTERPETPSHTEAPASGVFASSAAGSNTADTPQIAIDDFVKIDLRVAQIVVAERIPKADKLLRLEVDLGYEKRQILSGIAEWYTPEELIGRRIVVIANLAPRKMRGLESHGMLLAASAGENGKPVLATFGEEIALGSRLK
ncbi:MAG TPA: methionine--tRNA ligase subunit beta [Edaphobacter sp.]|nr:methionine--tRNA ligase subunit beta [Edaphobacter sp.]